MMSYAQFFDQWFDDNDYIIAHTSGSTGEPKTMYLKKCDMLASARATNAFFGLSSDAVYLTSLSSEYIAGKMMAVRAVDAHATLVALPPSNRPTFSGCSLLAIVPSQVDELVKHSELAPDIKNIIIGGANLSPDRCRALIAGGFNAYESYGMTETCSHIALRRVTADGDENFTAMPRVTFTLDDRGCLVADLAHLTVGRIITNDIVSLTDCRHFKWLGRYDNVINTGGIKVFPEQLERQIANILSIEGDFYITSENDDFWGERVIMIVEAHDCDESALINKMKSKLLPHQCPKRVHCVPKLFRTDSGKIKRLKPGELLSAKFADLS